MALYVSRHRNWALVLGPFWSNDSEFLQREEMVATADIELPSGTTVRIEGTVEEVAALIARISSPGGLASTQAAQGSKGTTPTVAKKARERRKSRGPLSLISELAEEDYFREKRTIGDIQKKLEERGHIYAQPGISPALTRLTRRRTIRRIKEKKAWVYVN